jgi:type I restriction enzyme S subunit
MFSHGTTHQTIDFPEVKAFHVCMPPLPEQRAIAHILGAIDDKIDLNRRMAATLEDMARALFTSWFVRFDPVRAKMAGQPTGLPPHIDALFPDALVDSELGEVPEGWAVGPLSSMASLARDTINPLNFPDETFAHFSLPAFDDGQLPVLERGASIQSNKFHLTDDVVLLTKLNPHIPRNWMATRSATYRSVASTEFMPFRAAEGSSREFLYSLFDSPGFRPQYLSLVSGTTGSHQRVQPPGVLAIDISIPPVGVVREYTRLVGPMLGNAMATRARNQLLSALRDTLLPKLVSGELRIPDPEAFLRRAGLDAAA